MDSFQAFATRVTRVAQCVDQTLMREWPRQTMFFRTEELEAQRLCTATYVVTCLGSTRTTGS